MMMMTTTNPPTFPDSSSSNVHCALCGRAKGDDAAACSSRLFVGDGNTEHSRIYVLPSLLIIEGISYPSGSCLCGRCLDKVYDEEV